MANQHTSEWSNEIIERMLNLAKIHKLPKVTEMINKEFGINKTYSSVRTKYMRVKGNWEPKEETNQLPPIDRTLKRNKDGTWDREDFIELNEAQEKDEEYMLMAHGFDPEKWDIVELNNSAWNQHNKQDGTVTLFSSKIKVKPKSKKNNEYDNLIETIESGKPFNIKINYKPLDKHYLLEIAPVDTHFGISSFEYYGPNIVRIINKIKLRHWEQIVIPVGNDLFHNDDFRGRTSSGREIQKVDMGKAWTDAEKFYYTIIDEAKEHANHIKIVYVRGNHDESMSWAFVKNLMTKYPNLEFDDSFEEHKGHSFHDVFLGFTHGEKNRKNTANIFNTKFRLEIAKAKVREIHQAHLHEEKAQDHYGIMVRGLPTQNLEDDWHDQNGYVGKNKRFQLFEYSEDTLESIHYV
ncbi:hypothetical protein [Ornithinibacillus xuwenensis]|uniref:Calcineurin-like phosphoesterase domain-containing protein n=1 Tax=Ornithinibacillus xuwenensis TaxID=3144668 RepID=A0ABU9XBX4_9BACI